MHTVVGPRPLALIKCVAEGIEDVTCGKIYLVLDETIRNFVFMDDRGETAMLAKERFELFPLVPRIGIRSDLKLKRKTDNGVRVCC